MTYNSWKLGFTIIGVQELNIPTTVTDKIRTFDAYLLLFLVWHFF